MKKMYNINPDSYNKSKKIIIKLPKPKVRNLLHLQNQQSNMAYVEKDKTKIIPRKQKYKESFKDYE